MAEADNGAVAIELFRNHQPDVTLMDLSMPWFAGPIWNSITLLLKAWYDFFAD